MLPFDGQRYHAYFMEDIDSWLLMLSGPTSTGCIPFCKFVAVIINSYLPYATEDCFFLMLDLISVKAMFFNLGSRLGIIRDWLAVIACSTAILGLIQSSARHRQWIWYSFAGGVLLAIFWLYYMLRLPKFRWDVIWLPLGPISGAGLCLYVDHLLNESSSEVRKLRSYMYAYKAM
ncbi:hypothetical protein KSS87_002519 [Heliosperma pusillum]|nr:hypothetical protein KSS87_020095 [Heliosperma pusillum]KAH9622325.1 hypothetical protein KSS87_002519 [Heliosperma pusillum]